MCCGASLRPSASSSRRLNGDQLPHTVASQVDDELRPRSLRHEADDDPCVKRRLLLVLLRAILGPFGPLRSY